MPPRRRIEVVKDLEAIALYTRTGRDCSRRLPGLVQAFHGLPVRSCIIDGELVADEEDHAGDIWTLHRAMREGRHEQICVAAFDCVHLDGRDLRALAWTERNARLRRLTSHADLPELLAIEHFDDGERLLTIAEKLGLEGVVSKRRSEPYRSGRQPCWTKVKCPTWREKNRERWRLFV
jgi:bifunctional non-homologous end joining protein LigD